MTDTTLKLKDVLARMMLDVINGDLSTYQAEKMFSYLDPSQGQKKAITDRESPLIDVLNLSARAHNALIQADITHLAMLTRLARWQIMRFQNIGDFSVDEITRALIRKGLQLNTEYATQKITNDR